MIRVNNNNCAFGNTTIEFSGYQEKEHLLSYLMGRSGNIEWDRPYLNDPDVAIDWIKKQDFTKPVEVKFCMGGGSVPDYEHITIQEIGR